ncbi:hypothetical protein PGQ11_007779 [Apiospora arundinis]|uniref:2EXR domain-containing protein n=1 Tax=Apiospora arundinis TaxID=335852 RepID=A0ABR2IY76_9PEZI
MFNIHDLPPELEDEVWRWALPAPRILWVTAINGNDWKWCTSSRLVPTLLHVCSQSRRVCRRTYQRLQTTQPVYIDYDRDIVLIHSCGSGLISTLIDAYPTGLRAEYVRHAGLLESGWYSVLYRFPVARFAGLQTLTVFIGDQTGPDVEYLDDEVSTGAINPLADDVLARTTILIGFREAFE